MSTWDEALEAMAEPMGTPVPFPLADYERQQFTRPGRARVNVQWKGIPSCFDIHCECGVYVHLDDEYYGRWKCGGCGRSFQLAWTATAYEVEPVVGETTTEPEQS